MSFFVASVAIATLTAIMPLAVSGSANPASDYIPEGIFGLVELDPTEVNDTIQNLYKDGLSYLTVDFVPYSASAETEENVMGFLDNLYGTQASTAGVTSPNMDVFIFTALSQPEYDDLIALYEGTLTILFTEGEESNEAPIYKIASSTYLMHHEGYMVISSTEDFLNDLYDGFENPLSENSSYSAIKNKFLNSNFINVYIDFETINSQFGASALGLDTANTTIIDAFEQIGFSLKQNSDGFSFQEHVITNPDILSDLGINYSNGLHVPYLYEFMPSQKPILYGEVFNLSERWNSLIGIDNFTDELEDETQELVGLSVEEDILPLFEQGAAYLVQDRDEMLPVMTFLVDVGDKTETAENVIETLVDAIWTSPINSHVESLGDDFTLIIRKGEDNMLGGTMTTFEFQVNQSLTQNPYAITIPKEWLTFNLTLGVTEGDFLLLSTNSHIEDDYGDDLTSDNDFNEVFDHEEEEISELGYLNIDNFGNYVNGLLNDLADIDEEHVGDFQETRGVIDEFLDVFQDFYSISITTNESITVESEFRFDLQEVAELWGYLQEMSTTAPSSWNAVGNSNTDFDDISTEDWYADDVYYLTSEGIVTGYEDETFQPSNEISRAEFLTMLMRALEEKGYFTDVCVKYWECDTDGFSDVNYYDWYGEYAYRAQAVGIIEGYEDGTFLPSNTITRAEASVMIANALNSAEVGDGYTTIDTLNFYDVDEDDWYYESILEAKQYEIIEGVTNTTFEPLRSINRAESAKMIRGSLEILR